jgi:hypothetical protein
MNVTRHEHVRARQRHLVSHTVFADQESRSHCRPRRWSEERPAEAVGQLTAAVRARRRSLVFSR